MIPSYICFNTFVLHFYTMAAPLSHFQRHKYLCTNAAVYPNSLLRRPRPHEVHALQKHAKYLEENDKRLFSNYSEEHLIEIFEIDAEKRREELLAFCLAHVNVESSYKLGGEAIPNM
jgi:hypothetical protein